MRRVRASRQDHNGIPAGSGVSLRDGERQNGGACEVEGREALSGIDWIVPQAVWGDSDG